MSGAREQGQPVRASRVVRTGAQDAFRLVADVRHHPRWIPLTTAHCPPVPPGPLPVGTRFVMHSRPAIHDEMVVTALDTQGPRLSTTFRKTGSLLLGTAGIVVEPLTDRTSRVTWWEDVHLAGPLPPALTRLGVRAVLRGMTALALRSVAREIARSAPR